MDAPPAPPFWRSIALTFQTCVRNTRVCVMLTAPYALLVGVALAAGRSVSLNIDPTTIAQSELALVGIAFLAAVGALVLIGLFVYPPTIGALSLVGSAAVEGDAIDASGVLRRAVERGLDTVGAFVLSVLICVGPVIALGVLGAIVSLVTNARTGFAVIAFAMFVLLAGSVYIFVRLSLAVPVVMREGLAPMDALRSSWDLVRGHWPWVFGVYVTIWVASFVVFQIASRIGGAFHGPAGFVVVAIVMSVATSTITSLVGVASGIVYSARTLPHMTPVTSNP